MKTARAYACENGCKAEQNPNPCTRMAGEGEGPGEPSLPARGNAKRAATLTDNLQILTKLGVVSPSSP